VRSIFDFSAESAKIADWLADAAVVSNSQATLSALCKSSNFFSQMRFWNSGEDVWARAHEVMEALRSESR
jgi:hypothetical protein